MGRECFGVTAAELAEEERAEAEAAVAITRGAARACDLRPSPSAVASSACGADEEESKRSEEDDAACPPLLPKGVPSTAAADRSSALPLAVVVVAVVGDLSKQTNVGSGASKCCEALLTSADDSSPHVTWCTLTCGGLRRAAKLPATPSRDARLWVAMAELFETESGWCPLAVA